MVYDSLEAVRRWGLLDFKEEMPEAFRIVRYLALLRGNYLRVEDGIAFECYIPVTENGVKDGAAAEPRGLVCEFTAAWIWRFERVERGASGSLH